MKKTIGILGGMGPLATADLFRKLILMTDAPSDAGHARIYIDNNSQIPDRTAAILEGGADPLPAMAESLHKLEQCGADCVIMPCNTAHYFLPRLQDMTKTPILNMLEITARTCRKTFPGKTAAILGTSGTLSAGLYQRALDAEGIPFLTPSPEEQATLMRVIYWGVKAGRPPEDYRKDFAFIREQMNARGAEYYILGCTELPVAAEALQMPERFVDPTAELAKAALRFCGYPVK